MAAGDHILSTDLNHIRGCPGWGWAGGAGGGGGGGGGTTRPLGEHHRQVFFFFNPSSDLGGVAIYRRTD